MESSSRAVTAADAGRGIASPLVPKEYRINLPSLPSGEAMRRAVALHCDVSDRPYLIDDFRKPLEDLGVIQQVSGIGAYHMSQVWLLNMTEQAKKALRDAGVLKVKDRVCLVMDPTRQDIKMKLHWLAFDVTKDAIRRALYEYGDVKEKQTTSADAPGLNKSKQVYSALDTNAERRMGNPAATDYTPTTSEQTRPPPAMHAASQLQTTRPETPVS
ncbi:hypothetical protein HPB51_004936 [Rhipicephalus microplus]|uniref:Uncharacterized protein n=1 Tax=Rhipicephalus microplus TaxID=6941 RepID=A0A9J6DZL6_RHIMP|nr:hypothetical protein HPB51_004936 [Rhipicephalus microplus]